MRRLALLVVVVLVLLALVRQLWRRADDDERATDSRDDSQLSTATRDQLAQLDADSASGASKKRRGLTLRTAR